MEFSGMRIFKYLPAAKKEACSNCKKCGFPTCMAFALKLAKNQTDINLCEHVPDELRNLFEQNSKKPQKEILLGVNKKVLVGGENVLFRHDKTFINPTALAVSLDFSDTEFDKKLQRILDFKITRIEDEFRVDAVLIGGNPTSEVISKIEDANIAVILEEELTKADLTKIDETNFAESVESLVYTRRNSVLKKADDYSNPTYIYFKHQPDIEQLCAKAAYYLCKYANMIIFEDFDEALMSTLITLRQNIFTDPQKPLMVEAKVYEFNNADENSIIFLTTNFALTYFAVSSEIESLNTPTYLIVTPSDGMSVLTAWSAEKFTAQIAAKTVQASGLADKVKVKKIIIPGLLGHMKEELQEAIPDFEIIIGTVEAYKIKDFVKEYKQKYFA